MTVLTSGPGASAAERKGEGATVVAALDWASLGRENEEGGRRKKNFLFFFQINFPNSFSKDFLILLSFGSKPLNTTNKMLQHEYINMQLTL
jgi:hypothetical protein